MESSKEIQRIKEKLEGELNKTRGIKYKWISDGGSCESCSSLDGKIFDSLSEAPTPPLHPNCKCKLESFEVEENIEVNKAQETSFLEQMQKVLEYGNFGKDVSAIFLEEYAILRTTNAIGNDKHHTH